MTQNCAPTEVGLDYKLVNAVVPHDLENEFRRAEESLVEGGLFLVEISLSIDSIRAMAQRWGFESVARGASDGHLLVFKKRSVRTTPRWV